jgi:hypothetical protein
VRTSTARSVLAAAAVAALTATVQAAGPTTAPATRPDADAPEVVRLTLTPVAVTDPGTTYPLLPPLAEQHTGDAAYAYLFATSRLPPAITPEHQEPEIWNGFERVEDAPAGSFPAAEAADVLGQFPTDLIDDAARCEHAHWDVGFRERGIAARLPYLNDMRTLARVTAVRGRLDLARGDFAGAARAVQTNLAIVRHLDGDAFVILVQSLVATGIENLTMDNVVRDWVSRGASPNLYWSLSSLPPTFTNLYAVAESEQAGLRFSDAPWIALAMDDRLPADQWLRVVQLAMRYTTGEVPKPGPDFDAARHRFMATFVGPAREHLRKVGTPGPLAAAMSDDEAVGRYLIWQYRTASDRTWRAFTLPFHQAAAKLKRADAVDGDGDGPAAPFTFRSAFRARFTFAATDERVAALRVIEALRDHAAHHGGRPPASLDEIADLPIPPDPVTGRPFVYRADGATAVLGLPAPAGVGPQHGYRYELTFTSP